MNRSKGAAVMLLVGAFAAGAGSLYAGSAILKATRESQPNCPQPRIESSYVNRFGDRLGLDSTQRKAIGTLIDDRNQAVAAVYAIPRAKRDSINAGARAAIDSIFLTPNAQADSIRDESREKQNAVFTPEQRARLEADRKAWEERRAAQKAQQEERQAECMRAQQKQAPDQSKQQSIKNKSNH